MKKHITISVLLGLVFMNASVFAETKYGPVITIKPKGVQATSDQADGKPAIPSAQGQMKIGEKTKAAGLLLPAVQKVRSASSTQNQTQNKKINKDEDGTNERGGLDRDLIRHPSSPKPKPAK